MGWLGDGSHRRQGRQAWTAVGLPPRYPKFFMASHLRTSWCHQIRCHIVLLAARHRQAYPALTPARKADTRLPGGMEGWIDLSILITHLRSGRESNPRPRDRNSKVRRPNRCATKTLLVLVDWVMRIVVANHSVNFFNLVKIPASALFNVNTARSWYSRKC